LVIRCTIGREKIRGKAESPAAWGMAVRNNESRDRRTHLREKLAALAEK
jgi:hypothetical protein